MNLLNGWKVVFLIEIGNTSKYYLGDMMGYIKRRITNSGLPNKDTLFIIGNGFDIWTGLNTHYSDFQNYYVKNRDRILKKLKIKKIPVYNSNGECNI